MTEHHLRRGKTRAMRLDSSDRLQWVEVSDAEIVLHVEVDTSAYQAAMYRAQEAIRRFGITMEMAAENFRQFARAIGIRLGVRTVHRPPTWPRWKRRLAGLAVVFPLAMLAAVPHG